VKKWYIDADDERIYKEVIGSHSFIGFMSVGSSSTADLKSHGQIKKHVKRK